MRIKVRSRRRGDGDMGMYFAFETPLVLQKCGYLPVYVTERPRS